MKSTQTEDETRETSRISKKEKSCKTAEINSTKNSMKEKAKRLGTSRC